MNNILHKNYSIYSWQFRSASWIYSYAWPSINLINSDVGQAVWNEYWQLLPDNYHIDSVRQSAILQNAIIKIIVKENLND